LKLYIRIRYVLIKSYHCITKAYSSTDFTSHNIYYTNQNQQHSSKTVDGMINSI